MAIDSIKGHFFYPTTSPCTNAFVTLSHTVKHAGELLVPGSKSFTNRALVIAGQCRGPCEFEGALFAEDSYWACWCLEALGFSVFADPQKRRIVIQPPNTAPTKQPIELFLGKSGTLARFLPAVVLNWQSTFPNWPELVATVNADQQLRQRPIEPLIVALKILGAQWKNSIPGEIHSSSLEGNCEVSGEISGQFLSGLLITACGANKNISIKRTNNLVQPGYITMTLEMIKKFGAIVHFNETLEEFSIKKQRYSPQKLTLEADASTACAYIAMALLHGIGVDIVNLGYETIQPDYKVISLWKEAGLLIEQSLSSTKIRASQKNSWISLPSSIDGTPFSDQSLILGILALFSQKPLEIKGISHIRHHESNRIAHFVANLGKLGLKAQETKDGFVVYPMEKDPQQIEGTWYCHDDHRFAMAGFILGSKCPNVVIDKPSVVEKTAPQFYETMAQFGFKLTKSSCII